MREEAYPGEELYFTDFSRLGWETPDGVEDLLEEGEEAAFAFCWGVLEAGVPFVDGPYAKCDGATECYTCYYTEDFELCVSKEPDVFWEIQISGYISNDAAETCDSACHGIRTLLLMTWTAVENEGSNTSLHYENQYQI